MAIQVSRRDRRILKSDNRKQPATLQKVTAIEWAHINSIGGNRIEVWRSRDFLVQVFAEKDGVERLTICRTSLDGDDWGDRITWDDLQRLKRECGRGERDAVEIYPADRDVVNVANMRHLWVVPANIPFKWTTSAAAALPE
jgi:hypothetical protein